MDLGHAVKDLDNVAGNEVDAVSRLLLGDAWLQKGSRVGGWELDLKPQAQQRNDLELLGRAGHEGASWEWQLTIAKALRQMALVRLARMAMPTLVQPRLMRCSAIPAHHSMDGQECSGPGQRARVQCAPGQSSGGSLWCNVGTGTEPGVQ